LYHLFAENKIKKGIFFLIAAALTVITLFLPLIMQNGLDFITFYPSLVKWNMVIMNLTYLIGLLALAFLVVLMIISSKNINNVLKKDKNTIFALSTIILICSFFLICPYEVEYLLPAIPFALFFISKISNRRLITILCVLLILNSFVSISTPPNIIEKGVIFDETHLNIEKTKTTQKIIDMPLNDSIIISGEYYPIFRYLIASSDKSQILPVENNTKKNIPSYWDTESNRGYVYMADADEIIKWQNKGYKIYYMGRSACSTTELNYGYDLNALNCSNIFESVK
ncbi:MAG TPA: hypothetical protein GX531_04680, partial [Methanothermobacter sp.]|nr:hypothetical protein [Methanothermobacter sp.]